MGKENFKEALKALERRKIVTSLGTVTKVSGTTCEVDRKELPKLTDVRLHSVAKDLENYILITPAEGSQVVCLEIEGAPEETCIVKYGEIESFKVIIDGCEISTEGGKMNLKNTETSLKSILNSLFQVLQSAVIQTPSGPGSFSLDNIQSFKEMNINTNKLLS
ncbi:hypothetical protein [Psychroflexus sp. ALD_RP9]|uniref:hypothetical protein n=1 Tax=Psychroflexus sp. ALD_RP9 TaxID=2777186 RepID=UPI001A8D46C3|nr:hypothetical protein [Psychroflexus sp. ALD_RP9]QSS96584.1 hypothetical protein IMZ30_09035 [Psychroflexus sp. ALD_RP9]